MYTTHLVFIVAAIYNTAVIDNIVCYDALSSITNVQTEIGSF